MRSDLWLRALTGAALVSVILGAIVGGRWTWSVLLAVLLVMGWAEARRALATAFPERSGAWVVLCSVAMVALPIGGLFFMAWQDGQYDAELPLGWFLLLWVNDTAAYLFGRTLGRHKMAPAISPGKTWEGWAGGALSTIGVAVFVLGPQGWGGLSPSSWGVLGALVSVFGPAGDLLESALKRKAGIKDSGNALPGHGGVLDRFDSHFISAPVAAILLQLF